MLLEVTVKNFKIFSEEATFSMQPVPKQKDLSYSILHDHHDKKSVRALSSSVIFGPNASGKSTVLEAVDFLKTLILSGGLKGFQFQEVSNRFSDSIDTGALIANKACLGQPVVFKIVFLENHVLFEYEIHADLGNFAQSKRVRSVKYERLKINEEQVFVRKEDQLSVWWTRTVETVSGSRKPSEISLLMQYANRGLLEDELFLSNGFKNLISPELFRMIRDWFEKKLIVICRPDQLDEEPILDFPREDDSESVQLYAPLKRPDYLNRMMKEFGITDHELKWMNLNGKNQWVSLVGHEADHQVSAVPAEMFESLGTIRFIRLLLIIIRILISGGTLLCDELDNSIHIAAVMKLITCFHDDEINLNNAQLIFTSHDPYLISSTLFRRDEIKLIDKDQNGAAEIYSLADFGTAGPNGIRTTDDYAAAYTLEKIGAYPNLDFSDTLKSIVYEAQGRNLQ